MPFWATSYSANTCDAGNRTIKTVSKSLFTIVAGRKSEEGLMLTEKSLRLH
jgi:hypothetical protein